MEEPSQMTVLGILMQRDAEKNQPDSLRAASWQAISQTISQSTPVAARPAAPGPFAPKRARTALTAADTALKGRRFPAGQPGKSASGLEDTVWNPRTAFNPQSAPRSSWHYPSRHFVYQTIMLVLVMVGFLAVGILFGPGGIKPGGPSTVTIPEDTIPLVNPTLPSIAELQAYLTPADSLALAGLPGLPAERQRIELEAICSRSGLTLVQLPAAGSQTYTYWTSRGSNPGSDRSLLILAREKIGQDGWTVVYSIVPSGQALPTGSALDDTFSELLADFPSR